MVINRPTFNDWSKVVLRVMLDAAQDAGAVFEPIRDTNAHLESLRQELNGLCEKAIAMGRAIREWCKSAPGFTTPELRMLAEKCYPLLGQLEQRYTRQSGVLSAVRSNRRSW